MKRIYTIFMMLALTFAALNFTACDSNDEFDIYDNYVVYDNVRYGIFMSIFFDGMDDLFWADGKWVNAVESMELVVVIDEDEEFHVKTKDLDFYFLEDLYEGFEFSAENVIATYEEELYSGLDDYSYYRYYGFHMESGSAVVTKLDRYWHKCDVKFKNCVLKNKRGKTMKFNGTYHFTASGV